MTIGVYKIFNIANGKCYIGSSRRVERRLAEHKAALISQRHKNPRLQNAWNAHGADRFMFRLLLACRISDLEAYEQVAIDCFDAYFQHGGYNLRPFAFVNKGRPGSEKQKEATRQQLLGVKNPKLSAYLDTPERKNLSRSQLASLRKDPEIENKRKQAICAAYSGEEIRRRQAQYVIGIKRSPETIEKLRIKAREREN